MSGRKRGTPKTGGRKKGTPNRVSASVKLSVEQAFEALGGVDELVAWARENRGDFYKLWFKLLPAQPFVDDASEEISQVHIYLPHNGRESHENMPK